MGDLTSHPARVEREWEPTDTEVQHVTSIVTMDMEAAESRLRRLAKRLRDEGDVRHVAVTTLAEDAEVLGRRLRACL